MAGSHTSFAASASGSGSENDDNKTEFHDENEHDEAESQGRSEDDVTESDGRKSDDGSESRGQKEYDGGTVATGFGMESSQLSSATSNVSTSLTSWSSSSNKPFRRRAEMLKESGKDSRSLKGSSSSTWDEPLILLD